MKLLLDTHIWLWMLFEAGRLSGAVVAHLDNLENQLWLSPISLWEASFLADKGRLTPGIPPGTDLRGALRKVPVQEASLTHEVALVSREMNLPHQDPADRFIAATAKVYGLTLVTQDEKLLNSGEFMVLANRAPG